MPPSRRLVQWLATVRATAVALALCAAVAPAAAAAFPATTARAGVRTVPDDAPTIRAALDAIYAEGTVAESVFVRVGVPMESLAIDGEKNVVLVGLPDPEGALPGIGALSIDNFDASFIARSLRFTAGIRISGFIPWPPAFFDCAMDSAVASGLDASLGMFRCTIVGHPRAITCAGPLVLDSCLVTGEVMAAGGNATLDVRHCTMTGPGSTALSVDALSCVAIGNTIRGYDTGIYTRVDGATPSILDNLIEDCPGAGIRATNGGEIRSNRVRSCGTGIVVSSDYETVNVTDNSVLGCGGTGMQLQLAGGSVRGNVVGRSGGDGLWIESAREYWEPPTQIVRNTSFSNGGSGFVLAAGAYSELVAPISNNLGFGNAGFGLVYSGASIPVLSCNDWFANVSGAVSGIAPSARDVALDPWFCDLAHDDVHLSAGSPLLDAPGCGSIGALARGCDTSPGHGFELAAVTPNPGPGAVTIGFALAREAAVVVNVLDLQGRLVRSIAHGTLAAGTHAVEWSDRSAAPGVYLLDFRYPGGRQVRRFVRLR